MRSEKFQQTELELLRNEILRDAPNPWEVAELFQVFLADNGYGVSAPTALEAACRVGRAGCSKVVLQRELESLALLT